MQETLDIDSLYEVDAEFKSTSQIHNPKLAQYTKCVHTASCRIYENVVFLVEKSTEDMPAHTLSESSYK